MRIQKQTRQYLHDPQLASLANALRTIALKQDQEDRIAVRSLDRLKNVSFFPDQVTCRVRLCFSGKQCVIGITDNLVKAARFADMAKVFFWPYRLRDVRPPTIDELNFSPERAEKDLVEEVDAHCLLERLLGHFQKLGLLRTVKSGDVTKASRSTLRTDIMELTERMDTAVAKISTDSTHLFNQIKQAFQHLLTKQQEDHKLLEDAARQREELRERLGRIEQLLSPVQREEFPEGWETRKDGIYPAHLIDTTLPEPPTVTYKAD